MALTTKLAGQVEQAAAQAGLKVAGAEENAGFNGLPTELYTLTLPNDPAHRQSLELSANMDLSKAEFQQPVHEFLLQTAKRLRNPQPECAVTLGGLPISFRNWRWPFHLSTSGADTYIVHGEAMLEDGKTSPEQQLRAKISASMTVTFAEVVAAPEQPFAEGFIYNAVRKVMDQGQIELVKSGNRQPVPVTTRYYSTKQGRFIFNDTDEQQRQDFLASKVYWLSGVLGGNAPVWLLDPRDAQYLNTTVAELKKSADALCSDGLLQFEQDQEFAAATAPLMGHHAAFEESLAEAIAFIKPTFNESMRAGNTNM
ncbi:MAG: hypothetical protein INR71_08425 [Terriglobus roseus]|nr:hypothetical protein [Terriglobus roseus]